MTCKETAALTTDYLEGTLPSEKRTEFEAHLTTCPNCRTHVEQMRLMIGAISKLQEDRDEPEVPKELLDHFRARANRSRGRGQEPSGRRGTFVYADVAAKENQRRRILRISGMTAGVLLAAAIGAWFWLKSPLGPAHLRPVTVDLSNWAILRGPEGSPPNPPLQLAKGYLDMTLYLPAGSEPGTYDVQVVREPGQPIWSVRREVKLENYKATLRVQVDLRHLSPGLYLLAFRRQDRSWTYIPLVLE